MIFIDKYFIDYDKEIKDFTGEIDSTGVGLFIDSLDTFGVQYDVKDTGTSIEIYVGDYKYIFTGNNLYIVRAILEEYMKD